MSLSIYDGGTVLDKIRAGDTFSYQIVSSDYQDGWTCKLALRGPSSITLIAMSTGNTFVFYADSITTSAWHTGFFDYFIYVEKDGNRHQLESGTVEVLHDYSQETVYINKSWARQTLEAVEAVLQGRATRGEEDYQIAGRSIKKIPIPELIQLRSSLKQEVANEKAAERIAQGLKPKNKVLFRF